MFLSVFDLFKIGIGPSSSHTMGPMVAAGRFLNEILNGDWPRPYGATVAHIKVNLHGSLAYTGVGHASDRAVILGLCGELPATVDLDNADALLEQVMRTKTVRPAGHPAYAFDPAADLVLDKKTPLPGHANGMAFSALDRDGRQLLRIAYFSVGGGFVVDADELAASKSKTNAPQGPSVPYPFKNASNRSLARNTLSVAISIAMSANAFAQAPAPVAVAAPPPAAAAAPATPPAAAGAPKPFKEVIKDAKEIPGLFNL